MSTKINILLNKKLKNPVVLIGLPGIGLVGKIAIDYLVNELKPKCKKYAEIVSDMFPPAVHTKNGVLELISDYVYLYSTKKKDYLFVVGPVQPTLAPPINNKDHFEFSRELASFFKKQGVKSIYTFAGLNIGQKRLNTEPKVICVATDSDTLKKIELKKIKNLIINKNNVDSLISGVAGLLLGISYSEFNITGCCFMGETDQKLVFGDQGSAKSVLNIINTFFDFKVDTKKIDLQAKKIESSFNEISSQIKNLEEKKNQPVTYIR